MTFVLRNPFPKQDQLVSQLADRVFLLTRRWPNHANHSGYDLLGRYVGQPLTARPIPEFLLPDRLIWRFQRTMKGYDRTSMALELMAARHMATHRECLYHILYGDNCYNFLSLLNGWRGHHIVASYHHPPRKFAEFVRRTDRIKRLSSAFIVGSNQLSSFVGVLPRERVFLIPHPVDTSYYMPPRSFSDRQEDLCLFVGAHLRDFATLCAVIENAWIVAKWLKFVVVVHPKHVEKFEGVVGNYTLYTELEDAQLLSLYKKAAVLIQPLLDATANNAILEGLSCGLPMVVTDVGAVRDYVDEDCSILVPPYNTDAFLDGLLGLLSSREKRKQMSISGRARALLFDWQELAEKVRTVYAQILSSRLRVDQGVSSSTEGGDEF